MCTVSIKVDEAVLHDVLPELNNTAAISRWAQLLIDEHIRSLGAIRRKNALEQDMTPEQLYNVIAEEIDDIYANG